MYLVKCLVSGVLAISLERGKFYVERGRRWSEALSSSLCEREERKRRGWNGQWKWNATLEKERMREGEKDVAAQELGCLTPSNTVILI